MFCQSWTFHANWPSSLQVIASEKSQRNNRKDQQNNKIGSNKKTMPDEPMSTTQNGGRDKHRDYYQYGETTCLKIEMI